MQDDSLMEQSSYVMEHSIGTDMEFATINRLLAEFNLNRESTASQKRSPLKMLKITGDLVNDGASFSQQQRTEANNSPFARAQSMIPYIHYISHNKFILINSIKLNKYLQF